MGKPVPNPTDLLALNQQDTDIFMTYFNEDYLKIIKAINAKTNLAK